MKKLTREAFARARAFIFEYARPLEKATFGHEFEGGSVDAIFEALTQFRNADGGFGNALEPDLRLSDSSVLATTVGLQVLRDYSAGADHPLVQGAMRYLMSTYDVENEVWPIIPPTADSAPHAPWWGYSDDIAGRGGSFLANPRAEIVGYLHDYAALVPDALRNRLTEAMLAHIERHADGIQMFDLHCYVRLLETKRLPPAVRTSLMDKLGPVVNRLVSTDAAEWEKYVLAPLEIVDRPESPFADQLADAVAKNLDFAISRQAENGAWEPKWSWGDSFPGVWTQAKLDWSGVITARTLKIISRFGRLES
ncbi:MAG: hypothetical protein MUQ30_17685 [Anaerolineae bacterium]|nr:hypothetical protein [Anaerolineae bacterium]